MKSRDRSDEVVTNIPTQRSLGISDVAKVVRILTESLYGDPIGSIVREISSNMIDAHKEAGVDTPPRITLPTTFDPNITFRDYGRGLSRDFMENKYTLVGFSTKEGTNEQIGKWGLGRLTPLSYVSSYTVNSYQRGVKNTYIISKDPKEGAKVSWLGNIPTDEPDGLEVSFPVQQQGIIYFKQATQFFWSFLGQKPVTNVKLDYLEKTFSGNKYFKVNSYDNFVKMGPVTYKLDKTTPSLISTRGIEGYVMEFDIGDLEVTPSREGLSYDEDTSQKINTRIEHLKENIVKDLQREVNKCPNLWEAWKKVQDVNHNFGSRITYYGRSFTDLASPNLRIMNYDGRLYREPSLYGTYKVLIVVTSVSKDLRRSIEKYFKENSYSASNILVYYLRKGEEPDLIKTLCNFDNLHVVPEWELPDVEVDKKNYTRKYKPVPIERYSGNTISVHNYTKEELKAGGYYLKIENKRYLDSKTFCLLPYLNKIHKVDNVALVPKTHWNKFKNWTILDHKNFDMEVDYFADLVNSTVIHTFKEQVLKSKYIDSLKEKPFKDTKYDFDLSEATDLVQRMGKEAKVTYVDMNQLINKRYPLLAYVRSAYYTTTEDLNKLKQQYIDLMEKEYNEF